MSRSRFIAATGSSNTSTTSPSRRHRRARRGLGRGLHSSSRGSSSAAWALSASVRKARRPRASSSIERIVLRSRRPPGSPRVDSERGGASPAGRGDVARVKETRRSPPDGRASRRRTRSSAAGFLSRASSARRARRRCLRLRARRVTAEAGALARATTCGDVVPRGFTIAYLACSPAVVSLIAPASLRGQPSRSTRCSSPGRQQGDHSVSSGKQNHVTRHTSRHARLDHLAASVAVVFDRSLFFVAVQLRVGRERCTPGGGEHGAAWPSNRKRKSTCRAYAGTCRGGAGGQLNGPRP